MEHVDLVLVGAEAIAQNGGLINQIGTYQIAVVAKAANKPFYSVTERYAFISINHSLVIWFLFSFKYVRIYPLNQSDLYRSELKFSTSNEGSQLESDNHVDYTPPELISSYISNLGILSPSGIIHLIGDEK
jgi:translation initiation factor eIF-2B subunit alpha